MTREKMKGLNLTPIEDLITEDFGAEGTPTRMEFDADADAFILGERLKEERQKAGLTQELRRLALHRSNLLKRSELRKVISRALRMVMPIYRCLHF